MHERSHRHSTWSGILDHAHQSTNLLNDLFTAERCSVLSLDQITLRNRSPCVYSLHAIHITAASFAPLAISILVHGKVTVQ